MQSAAVPNSYAIEREGVARSLLKMESLGVLVRSVTTDKCAMMGTTPCAWISRILAWGTLDKLRKCHELEMSWYVHFWQNFQPSTTFRPVFTNPASWVTFKGFSPRYRHSHWNHSTVFWFTSLQSQRHIKHLGWKQHMSIYRNTYLKSVHCLFPCPSQDSEHWLFCISVRMSQDKQPKKSRRRQYRFLLSRITMLSWRTNACKVNVEDVKISIQSSNFAWSSDQCLQHVTVQQLLVGMVCMLQGSVLQGISQQAWLPSALKWHASGLPHLIMKS